MGDKKGSALLIVLGMFAFMLVSAVAFSVYMRASRAPSSYVRRNTSTRQVLKAALARAIDEVDTAIGNDPFPGVGFNHDYGNDGINQSDRYKNDNWHGRVFTPSNEVALSETVSTLTLEGLGYLPACLVNEVRYWSRHSRTARWHSFNYGLGRYAFTAVNVSDFFDLNTFIKPASGSARQYLNRSSAPHGRISPTYLFRGGQNGDMDTGGSAASTFLNVLASGSGVGGGSYPSLSEVPFTSMMDFNLAVGVGGLGDLVGLKSPFVNLVQNNNNSTFLSGDMEAAARRTVFMAGGWNGDSNLTYQAYSAAYGGNRINLRYPEYQPFAGYSWFPEATTLSHCISDVSTSHPFWNPYNDNFPVIATAMLCDYLDFDDVPLSLCIPCTEAVPMICGVELNKEYVTCTLRYKKGEAVNDGPADPDGNQPQKRIDECWLELDVNFEPTVTAVYPFVNEQPNQSSTFDVECYARVFFEEVPDGEDSGIADAGLRSELFDLGVGLDANWSSLSTDKDGKSYIGIRCACKSISRPKFGDKLDEKDAVVGDLGGRAQFKREIKLADLIFKSDGKSGGFKFDSAEDSNQIDFFKKGALRPDARINFSDTFKNDSGAPKFWPNVAMWVRIKDKDKTVDMVPAKAEYDSVNGAGNVVANDDDLFLSATGSTKDPPALRFFPLKSGDGIQPDRGVFSEGDTREISSFKQELKQKAYIANDPRINWAPEHWWATYKETDPKGLWLDEVQNFRAADTTRDSDIFMSVSNQGYLQSMYEWMMIPQVRPLNRGDNAWGVFASNVGGYDGVVRTDKGGVLHADVMWRTYRSDAFGYNDTWGSIDDLAFDDADNGLRVNPYTDSMNVMLGAFANMPRDWWAASTNHLANGKNYMAPGSTTFEDSYLFDWSCNYQDVYNMAYYWHGAFRRRDLTGDERGKRLYLADNWKDVFEDAVDWRLGELKYNVPLVDSAEASNFDTGILQEGTAQDILKSLTFAERKFLYGYLKGCFANTAQLFLLFVRAETTAGGAVGAGARAVALVWRDPRPAMDASGQFVKAAGGSENPLYGKDNAGKYLRPMTSNGPEESWRLNNREYPPHRTRILFYHQFD